jgi:hypothetical protein
VDVLSDVAFDVVDDLVVVRGGYEGIGRVLIGDDVRTGLYIAVNPRLLEHLAAVTTLMKVSATCEQLWQCLIKACRVRSRYHSSTRSKTNLSVASLTIRAAA